MAELINIKEIELEDLASFLKENGEKAFKAKQIWQWIWQQGATSFEQMTNISKITRDLLATKYCFNALEEYKVQISSDGTKKTLWKMVDSELVESVLIPSKNKYTVCVSSQVGCKLACKFCATGDLGFKRNLSASEIFEQVIRAKQDAEALGSTLSNIVFMGMGEPLQNLDNVLKAIEHITSEKGMAMSPYRITVSTAGIPNQIRRLADAKVRFNLAISLHSAKNGVRADLMPIAKAHSLVELANALKYFVEQTGTRPTFEYLLLKGINDSLDDAKALAEYCRNFPIKINIIEYNSVSSSDYSHSPDKSRDAFAKYLENRNMIVTVRRSKGQDIDAACGQLAGKTK